MRHLTLIASLFIVFCASSIQAQSEASIASGKVFWRGSVDDKVHLIIRGAGLEQKTIAGAEKPVGTFSFTAPLPEQAVTVNVIRAEMGQHVGTSLARIVAALGALAEIRPGSGRPRP